MYNGIIFYALAVWGLYVLVVAWRREAQANALAVPLALASLQLLVVLISTYLDEIAGHPGGPTAAALIHVFFQGLLPPSLVQTFLVGRRKPDLFAKIAVPWPLSLVLRPRGWGWLMILLMAQLTIGTATRDTWSAIDITIVALQATTLVAMVLIQTRRIGPPPPNPVAQTFE